MSAYNEFQLSSFIDQVFARLRAIEAQLAILSQEAGVAYTAPSQEAPAEVVELVQAGDRIGAIRKCRELTGCGIDEAKEIVAGL